MSESNRPTDGSAASPSAGAAGAPVQSPAPTSGAAYHPTHYAPQPGTQAGVHPLHGAAYEVSHDCLRKERPAEVFALSFGIGVVTGIVMASVYLRT